MANGGVPVPVAERVRYESQETRWGYSGMRVDDGVVNRGWIVDPDPTDGVLWLVGHHLQRPGVRFFLGNVEGEIRTVGQEGAMNRMELFFPSTANGPSALTLRTLWNGVQLNGDAGVPPGGTTPSATTIFRPCPAPAGSSWGIPPGAAASNRSSELRRSLTWMREAGIGGQVGLLVYIDEEEVVQEARVQESSGHALLYAAAIRAVESFDFRPAMNVDRNVPVWIALPVTKRSWGSRRWTGSTP